MNEKFVNLIKDCYKKKLVGILYGAISTYGFSDIIDIDGLLQNGRFDMLYLKSRFTDTEIDIYEWELEDYKIKEFESTIYIKCKNKMEVRLMY